MKKVWGGKYPINQRGARRNAPPRVVENVDTMEHNVDENTDKNFSSGIHTWTPIVSSCSKVKDITRRATSCRRGDTGGEDPLSVEFHASRPLFRAGYIRLSPTF